MFYNADDYIYSVTKEKGDHKTIYYYDFDKSKEPKVVMKEFYYKGFLHNDKGPAVVSYDFYGDIIEEAWYTNGLKNRDGDLPAYIQYNSDKKIKEYAFYKNGILTRDKYPADVSYYTNGNFKEIRYIIDGKFHREDGPAVTSYTSNGFKYEEEYRINGCLHRDNGPALINYDYGGKVLYENYYKNGKMFRENGPTSIAYDEYGNIERELYYKDDKLHREHAPAVVCYFKDGKVRKLEYFIDGELKNLDSNIVQETYYGFGKIYERVYEASDNKNGSLYIERKNANGTLKYQLYKYKNNNHRLDGPAEIYYDSNGEVIEEKYFINDVEYDVLTYYVKINQYKNNKIKSIATL